MFVICREGHLGMFCTTNWIYCEEDSFVTSSRKQCLEYLTKFISKEKAVETITLLQKNTNLWYSF